MTTIHRIDLIEANANYHGILLQSRARFRFVGQGIHNLSFDHLLQVWQNRPTRARGADLNQIVDPRGRLTTARYSYLFTAIPSVIALHQIAPLPEVYYHPLSLGDVVELVIHGYSLGTFQVRAQRGYDPHLVPVDIESSASRQHYIDTGNYLLPGEEA